MIWIVLVVSMTLVSIILWGYVFKIHQVLHSKTVDVDEVSYTEDELLLTKRVAGNDNKVFKNTQFSQTVFDQYILSYEDGRVFFVGKPNVEITATNVMEIHCFNTEKKCITTLYVKSSQQTDQVLSIELAEGTAYINLNIFKSSDESRPTLEKYRDVHRTWMKIIKTSSFAMFFSFIPLGYFLLMFLSSDRFQSLLNAQTISLGLLLMVGLAVINYLWIKTKYARKYPI
jgi:hypothetical protein